MLHAILLVIFILSLFDQGRGASADPNPCAWAMFAHDPQRSSRSPCPGPSPAHPPKIAWTFHDSNLNIIEQPVLTSSDILLFIAGFEDWSTRRVPTNSRAPASAPACSSLIANVTLFALNASTGELLWKRSPVCQQPTGLTVNGNLLYMITQNGLQSVDVTTGTDVKLVVPNAVLGVLDIKHDKAYMVLHPYDIISTESGTELAAYNLTSGAELWNISIFEQGMFAGPSLGPDGTHIWVFGTANDLTCYDANSGATLWYFDNDGPSAWMPTVGTYGSQRSDVGLALTFGLMAVLESGTEAWDSPFVASGPALDGNNLTAYTYTSDNHLLAIDMESGISKWQTYVGEMAGLIGAPALASDGTLYYSYYWNLTAVHSTNGSIAWAFQFPQYDVTATGPIIGANGMLYVPGQLGTMYALN